MLSSATRECLRLRIWTIFHIWRRQCERPCVGERLRHLVGFWHFRCEHCLTRSSSGLQHVTMQVKSSQLGHKYAGLHDSLTRMIGMKATSSRKAPSVMPMSGMIHLIPWVMIIVDFPHRSLNRDRSIYVCHILTIFWFPLCLSHATQGPDADDFNPDRFMGKNGELLPPVADTRDGVLSQLCIA